MKGHTHYHYHHHHHIPLLLLHPHPHPQTSSSASPSHPPNPPPLITSAPQMSSSTRGSSSLSTSLHASPWSAPFSRFSSVFRRDNNTTSNSKSHHPDSVSASSANRMSNTAKGVIRKYLKKVKPLYEKLSSQKQQQQRRTASSLLTKTEESTKETERAVSHSFSGNVRYPLLRRRSCVSSCPSSIRSSPSHSGVPSGGGFAGINTSTTEELQNAIQGAIAHCKNSFTQNKTMVGDQI